MKRLALVLISLFSLLSHGQEKYTNLTSRLENLYKKSNFPGFSVVILDKDSVLYRNEFGFSDLKNKIPYTKNTIQNIGSVSKTVIGVALMKAIDLGYFDLDTDINAILPFKVGNPNLDSSEIIKIKHLVTHTSGILDDEEVYGKTFLLNKYSDKESKLYIKLKEGSTISNRTDSEFSVFLKSYLEKGGKWYKNTNFNKEKVGIEYNYSNIGAGLAAYLIEIKSKMPFDLFCKKYIFDTLKMKSTAYFLNDTLFNKHSKIYNSKKQYYPLYSEITYPDGSLKTSSHDLSLYLIEMIKGYYGQSKLITSKSFELLFKKQFKDNELPKSNDLREPNSGVFWRIKKNELIGHTGSDLGISTFMFFNPKTGKGKIFITNIEFDNPDNGKINTKLVKQFSAIWKELEKYEN